jgi:hypothetical protein
VLRDLNERIQLFGHPLFEDEAVGHCQQVLRSGLEVVPRQEDPLVIAARAVHHHCIPLLEGIQGLLEIDFVLWVFAELGLLGLSGIRIQLLVILLNVLLGGRRNREFPLIGSSVY